MEFFLSYEDVKEDILYGFLRLRLSASAGKRDNRVIINELVDAALIRELHVYGAVTEVTKCSNNHDSNTQHLGFGTKLMDAAESLAKKHGYKKISVISGAGVREYYRKKGYRDGQYYLNKSL